jgi:lipopolysaccharide/colanic/teichoic acid biosynthesis glycosyltransferase
MSYFQERTPASAGAAPEVRAPARLRPPSGRSPVPARPPAATDRFPAGPLNRDGGRTSQLLALLATAALPVADVLALVIAGLTTSAGAAAALYGLAVLAALAAGGLYRRRICLRVSDQAGRILVAVALPMLALLPFLPPATIARLGLVSAGLVVAFRLAASALLRRAGRRGVVAQPALIVGSGTFGAHLAQQLSLHPELGLVVRGFLDHAPRRDLAQPSLGPPEDLARVVTTLGIRRVIVCFGDFRDEDLVGVLRACRSLRADVCVVPRLHETGLAIPRGCLDEIWGIPLIPLRRIGRGGRGAGPRGAGLRGAGLRGAGLRGAGLSGAGAGAGAGAGLKRIFDVAGAAVLLTAALPLLLVLAAVIRLSTGQSPLFRQLRVTGNGRQARVLKLRTITGSGDADSGDPVDGDPDTCWTVEPARIGALGRLLRATHLDELPQLVNVLRGEMSLVGPRPERQHFAAQFAREIPRYGDRDRVRAGLTGWAQVHGLHGDTSIAERSRFDNQYIEYWSPWLDVVILLRTIGAAFAGLGARR